jgi:hypothetical protein
MGGRNRGSVELPILPVRNAGAIQEIVIRSELVGLDPNKPDPRLDNVLMVVSLFADYYQKEHYLKSIVATLINYYDNPKSNFNKITIYVAGLLQRHNFWNFTKDIKDDDDLDIFLGTIKNHNSLTEHELAKHLAKAFFSKALDAEQDFIKRCERLLNHNGMIHFDFKKWNDLIPVERNFPSPDHQPYFSYYQTVENTFNSAIESKYKTAISNFIAQQIGEETALQRGKNPDAAREKAKQKKEARQKTILEQSQRILDRLELTQLSCYKLASACCLNFLLEESAGFPILIHGEWSGLAYPCANKEELRFFEYASMLMKQIPSYQALTQREINWVHINLEKVKPQERYANNMNIQQPPAVTCPRSDPLNPVGHKPALAKEVREINADLTQIESAQQIFGRSKQIIDLSNFPKLLESIEPVSTSVERLYLNLEKYSDEMADNNFYQNFSKFFDYIPYSVSIYLVVNAENFPHETLFKIINLFYLRNFQGLILKNIEFDSSSFEDFCKLISICHSLKILFFNRTNLIKQSGDKVLNFIRSLKSIKVLDLSNNTFNRLSAAKLANLLSILPASIEILTLNSDCFSERSPLDLATIIQSIPNTVKSLETPVESPKVSKLWKHILDMRKQERTIIQKAIHSLITTKEKALSAQKENKVFSFFWHSSKSDNRISAMISEVGESKNIQEALLIIRKFLSRHWRKSGGLHKDSFDKFFIEEIIEKSKGKKVTYSLESMLNNPFLLSVTATSLKGELEINGKERIQVREELKKLASSIEENKKNKTLNLIEHWGYGHSREPSQTSATRMKAGC